MLLAGGQRAPGPIARTLTSWRWLHTVSVKGNFTHSDMTEAVKAAVLVQGNREWDGFDCMWCEAWWWWQPGLRPAEQRGCVLPLPMLSVSAWLHAAFLSCPPLFSLLRSCPGFYSSLANSLLEFPPPGEYKCDYWADVLPSRCPLQLPLSPLLILNLPQPF